MFVWVTTVCAHCRKLQEVKLEGQSKRGYFDILSNYFSTDSEINQSTTASDFCPRDGAKRLLPNPQRITEVSVTDIVLNSCKTNYI